MTTPTESACPRCGDEIPPDNDETGEGPVYWTISDEPFCSMECVIARHRTWLKEKERAEPELLDKTTGGQKALTDGWS